MSTHTPGPWKIDGPTRLGGIRVVAPWKPRCTYMVAEALPDCPDDLALEANARLIAAAPELLAALELIASGLEADGRTLDGMTKKRATEIARAAITKATK